MNHKIKAIYRNGSFELQESFDLPENFEVELIVRVPRIEPPKQTDPEERRRLRKILVEEMRRHPFPAEAPRWTRDELHARR